MRTIIATTIALCTLCTFPAAPRAQDVREASRKAQAERDAAAERAKAAEEQIFSDKNRLVAEVERLEALQAKLEKETNVLDQRIATGEKKHDALVDEWETRELEFREISGNVRVVARDVETLVLQSPLTAINPGRAETISPLLEKGYFPDIDDITGMAGVLFDEIERSGHVGFRESNYVGRDGEERRGRILTLGKFTSIYSNDGEIGFLNYSPEGSKFYALSALPGRGMTHALRKYLEGKSETVPIDLSGGAALRQISHKATFASQVRAGGPLVWPIGAIALAVIVIALYKIVVLRRVHGNTDKVMNEVNSLAADGKWDECKEIVRTHKGKNWPVINVIRDGLGVRREDRETLESVLQESILRELPRLESGLAVLAVFGAVAPLLGLLGTVTGMIDTFRVITLFGTGDPKLMSGGISEALVTTEFGLAVAIPTMLFHTFLSRRVGAIVGDMEEKAVALINIVQKDNRKNREKQKQEADGSAVASA